MPWTIDMLVPVRTEMRDQIMDGADEPAIRIFDNAGDLLATLKIASGEVDAETAVVTLVPGDPESNATKTGEADRADIINGSGVVLAENLPVVQGGDAVAGKIVISTTAIVAGGSVELVSATIGDVPEEPEE